MRRVLTEVAQFLVFFVFYLAFGLWGSVLCFVTLLCWHVADRVAAGIKSDEAR